MSESTPAPSTAGRDSDTTPPTSDLGSLTGLRWIAASAVFLAHSTVLIDWDWFRRIADQGGTAVTFFFILSGFVLTWSQRPRAGIRDFLRRRIARIYPAYLVISVLAIPLSLAVGIFTSWVDVALAIVSLTLFQAWIPSSRVAGGGIGSTWSVSVEAFFYITFLPIIGRLERRTSGWLFRFGAGVAAVAIALPIVVSPDHHHQETFGFWLVYWSPYVHVLEFILGVIAALLVRRGHRLPVSWWSAVALTSVAYVVAGWVPRVVAGVPLFVIPYLVLVVSAAQRDMSRTEPAVLSSPTMLKLGAWSYSFYLLHIPILRTASGVAERLGWGSTLAIAAVVACYLATTVASAVVYQWVEVPLQRRLLRR